MLRQTHGSQQYWLDYLQLFIETHFFSTAQLSFSVRCLHNESPSLFASGWDGLKHNQDRLRPSLESHHILTHLLLLLYFYILLMTTCWPPAKLQLPQTLRDQFRHKEFYKIIQVIVIVSSFSPLIWLLLVLPHVTEHSQLFDFCDVFDQPVLSGWIYVIVWKLDGRDATFSEDFIIDKYPWVIFLKSLW